VIELVTTPRSVRDVTAASFHACAGRHRRISAPLREFNDVVGAGRWIGVGMCQPSMGNRRLRASWSRAVCITERTWASTSSTSGFLPNWAKMSIGSST
jgi:hypothetical protein